MKKFITYLKKKWYNNITREEDKGNEISDEYIDNLKSTEPTFGSRGRIDYLQNNYEYYEKYGREKLASMIQALRTQLEAQTDVETTARLRGSVLFCRRLMDWYEAMPNEIDNILTKGKNIESKILNINNFNTYEEN